MVEQFEGRMVSYRQQIEMLESHLSALHQPVRHSPSEVFTLIKRLHESFIALAAQLQQVHEVIKVRSCVCVCVCVCVCACVRACVRA